MTGVQCCSDRVEKLLRFCLCLYMTKAQAMAGFFIFKKDLRNKVSLSVFVGCVQTGATAVPRLCEHTDLLCSEAGWSAKQELLRCCTR